MDRVGRWFLTVIGSVALTLGGLYWDGIVHQSEGHSPSEESLVSLSNPGHVLTGVGLLLTAVTSLTAFTDYWQRLGRSGGIERLSLPLTLWLVLGVLGTAALLAAARAG